MCLTIIYTNHLQLILYKISLSYHAEKKRRVGNVLVIKKSYQRAGYNMFM